MDARAGASPAVATRSERLSIPSSHLKSKRVRTEISIVVLRDHSLMVWSGILGDGFQ